MWCYDILNTCTREDVIRRTKTVKIVKKAFKTYDDDDDDNNNSHKKKQDHQAWLKAKAKYYIMTFTNIKLDLSIVWKRNSNVGCKHANV